MLKKCSVVMLPTNEKASIIGLYKDTAKLVFNNPNNKDIPRGESQHLYIFSDEEIKEGDYNVPSDFSKISDISKTSKEDLSIVNDKVNGYKKLIATTDSSLTKIISDFDFMSGESGEISIPALPQPSQSFIQKYVEEYNKGNIITEVMVEYEESTKTIIRSFPASVKQNYQLQVNPKDNTITIRKVKDNWTREEVIAIINKVYIHYMSGDYPVKENDHDITAWIAENL